MSRKSDNSHIRILLADLQDWYANGLTSVLRAEGYHVDRQDAAVSNRVPVGYDLIILDPKMPAGSIGLGAVRKANPAAQILAVQEKFEDAVGLAVDQSEIDGVISQSMSIDTLLKIVSYIAHGDCRVVAARSADSPDRCIAHPSAL